MQTSRGFNKALLWTCVCPNKWVLHSPNPEGEERLGNARRPQGDHDPAAHGKGAWPTLLLPVEQRNMGQDEMSQLKWKDLLEINPSKSLTSQTRKQRHGYTALGYSHTASGSQIQEALRLRPH